ncbi:putative transport permease YfiM [Sporosarcina sp. NCCP-2222]|uniref:ABC transporter permease n=1 Tax=Sporosarcina sp. NCCP-2222 TaxID=2935073 RepID=UPI002082872A|nr:ABC transporter permease [Sporosarcina sp. NCCP-2222]GKV57837.1 putative transport permease YfiM [Sporosarcina sp. NCCP-2222]
MKKMVLIAQKDIAIQLKDRKAFLLLLLMPFLLTAILGFALKGVMEGESLPATVIGVYMEEDPLAREFVENYLQQDLTMLTVKVAATDVELKDWVNQDEVDVGIILPKEWGEQKTPAAILAVSGKESSALFTQQLTDSFAQTAWTMSNSTEKIMTNLAVAASYQDPAIQPGKVQAELLNGMKEVVERKGQYVEVASIGEREVSSMQYYAAAMAAMFLLFNAVRGGKSLHQEQHSATLDRLRMTPTRVDFILGGKFLGTWGLAFGQFIVFMAATHFFLGVDWGESAVQTLFIGLVYSFAVSGLAILIAAFSANEKTADTAGGIMVQVLALLGGSMLPLSAFPEVMRKVALVLPNSWALNSFTSIMNGATWASLGAAALVLLAIGAASIVIGSARMRVSALSGGK